MNPNPSPEPQSSKGPQLTHSPLKFDFGKSPILLWLPVSPHSSFSAVRAMKFPNHNPTAATTKNIIQFMTPNGTENAFINRPDASN